MRKNFTHILLAALVATAGPLAYAQARPASGNIELKNIAEVEFEVKGADGKVEKKRAPVDKAIPGTVIFYTSTFKNISAKPAGNIVITNPIPANTTLVAASPYGEGMDITYSADAAKTWGAAAKLKVKGADGKERAASLAEITHIKWSPKADLAAGKQGEAGFRVVIN